MNIKTLLFTFSAVLAIYSVPVKADFLNFVPNVPVSYEVIQNSTNKSVSEISHKEENSKSRTIFQVTLLNPKTSQMEVVIKETQFICDVAEESLKHSINYDSTQKFASKTPFGKAVTIVLDKPMQFEYCPECNGFVEETTGLMEEFEDSLANNELEDLDFLPISFDHITLMLDQLFHLKDENLEVGKVITINNRSEETDEEQDAEDQADNTHSFYSIESTDANEINATFTSSGDYSYTTNFLMIDNLMTDNLMCHMDVSVQHGTTGLARWNQSNAMIQDRSYSFAMTFEANSNVMDQSASADDVSRFRELESSFKMTLQTDWQLKALP